MLTIKELEIVEELCSSLSDVKRKKALSNLLFEYRLYARCGSPEECAQRKEWMEIRNQLRKKVGRSKKKGI